MNRTETATENTNADQERDDVRRVETWLADFEHALAAPGDADLRALFLPECHWRDVLALTSRASQVS